MDGTIANFYGVPGWLECLERSDVHPYKAAAPLVDMHKLAAHLNYLRARGYHIGIVSWTSKCGTDEFNEAVKMAKLEWLKKHLKSVTWDEIEIIPYGFPKSKAVRYPEGMLFDDELRNLNEWRGAGGTVCHADIMMLQLYLMKIM
jgi:hypothetical protein